MYDKNMSLRAINVKKGKFRKIMQPFKANSIKAAKTLCFLHSLAIYHVSAKIKGETPPRTI